MNIAITVKLHVSASFRKYSRDCKWPVKSRKNNRKSAFFRKKKKLSLHISSSYAKILGETNYQPGEIPRSGSKAKDGEKRLNDGNINGQATHGARKHAWRTQAAWAKKRQ